MSVKRAVTLCSVDVALDIVKGPLPPGVKFIPRITFKDLKRSIRAFLGVVQYVQMHHPELHIIPKTMCQDDVENYFSLQRARVSGGKPTTLQFFESSASLETELLLSSEKKDTQGTSGSYDMIALSNHSGFSSSI